MRQIITDLPTNSIAAVREFMDKQGSKEMSQPSFTTTTYSKPAQQSRQYLPNSFSSPTSNWEFFRNELEFE